jgi:surface antigen
MRQSMVAGTVAVVLAISANGVSAQMGPKEESGAIGGALIGGAVGSFFGGNAGARAGAAVAGAMIGSFIGSRIGAALDEEDRQQLARMTRASMESNSGKQYTSRRTGAKVRTRVTSTNRNAEGQTCRTVEQEVVTKDGQVVKDRVTGCRGANGWSV